MAQPPSFLTPAALDLLRVHPEMAACLRFVAATPEHTHYTAYTWDLLDMFFGRLSKH